MTIPTATRTARIIADVTADVAELVTGRPGWTSTGTEHHYNPADGLMYAVIVDMVNNGGWWMYASCVRCNASTDQPVHNAQRAVDMAEQACRMHNNPDPAIGPCEQAPLTVPF